MFTFGTGAEPTGLVFFFVPFVVIPFLLRCADLGQGLIPEALPRLQIDPANPP